MIYEILFAFCLFLLFFLFDRKRNREQIKALTLEVLQTAQSTLLEGMGTQLVRHREGIEATLDPLRKTLTKLDEESRSLEKKREGAYLLLAQQLEWMKGAGDLLRKEVSTLSESLRSSTTRGSWGQLQLKRVIELAGLTEHVDFSEQVTITKEGKIFRPDLIIHLPEGRDIAIDAKVPLEALLTPGKTAADHAAALKKQMKELIQRDYAKVASPASIDFVILFLPLESFLSSALTADPTLLEWGMEQNLLLATPITLLAILRSIALAWKQHRLSDDAREVAALGAELYERTALFLDHFNKTGRHLQQASEAYNQSIASLESRLLVTARKLKDHAILTNKELLPPIPVTEAPQRENLRGVAP